MGKLPCTAHEFEDYEEYLADDLTLEDIYDVSEVEEADMYLEFAPDEQIDYGECETRAVEALAEYTLEEILQLNEIEEEEVLALLFYSGDLGLPVQVDSEEEQDTPPEENED